LIVSEVEMIKLLTDILEFEGFEVIGESSVEQALVQLEEQEPDMVILDIIKPESKSFQVLDLIRGYSDVPVIVLAANNGADSTSKVLLEGADDYIKKPFRTRVFLARVRAKLRRS